MDSNIQIITDLLDQIDKLSSLLKNPLPSNVAWINSVRITITTIEEYKVWFNI